MGSKVRPSPLRINRESKRIRKLPPLRLPVVQHRQPTIIHIHSPKVIQTHPNDFMSLVQRLTGRLIQNDRNSCTVHTTDDHYTSDYTALPSPLDISSASPDLRAAGVSLEPADVAVSFTSPRSSQLQQVKAHETLPNQRHDDTFSLTLSPLFLQPSSAFTHNVLASPPVWSPIPTPNILSQRFLADLPFLSPENDQHRNDKYLLSPSTRSNPLASSQLAWSPATTPSTLFQQLLGDSPNLSPQKRGPAADDVLLPSPRQHLSPQIIHEQILPASLRKSASKDLAQKLYVGGFQVDVPLNGFVAFAT